MAESNARFSSWGRPWLALTAAVAIHVVDEALNDFLSLWNPFVLRIREYIAWSPLPTFSFGAWAGGLAVLVAALALLSVFAYRGAPWLRPLAYALAVIMFLNGIGHIAVSIYLGRYAPGVYSSPLLLLAAAWLFVSSANSGTGTRVA
jgi:Protein of unknown function with HXXEE motif